jgi:Ca2+-binding RTX toxin-like protein
VFAAKSWREYLEVAITSPEHRQPGLSSPFGSASIRGTDMATIDGTTGADTLRGTDNGDVITGKAGDDVISGTIVNGWTDGDNYPDFVLALQGRINLTAGDFLL